MTCTGIPEHASGFGEGVENNAKLQSPERFQHGPIKTVQWGPNKALGRANEFGKCVDKFVAIKFKTWNCAFDAFIFLFLMLIICIGWKCTEPFHTCVQLLLSA